MSTFFSRFRQGSAAAAVSAPPAICLELSGPAIASALQALLSSCEEEGGIERYVEALKFKTGLFQDAFKDRGENLRVENFLKLCMFMPTVRRRIGDYVEPDFAGSGIWRRKSCIIQIRNCFRS